MGMLFRFVPYVGVPIAFLFPCAGAGSRSGLDQADLDRSAVWQRRSRRQPDHRAVRLWPQHAVGLSAVAVVVAAGVLDLAVGTRRPVAVDAAHCMCFVVLGRHIESLEIP